jgi:hypothetical protein
MEGPIKEDVAGASSGKQVSIVGRVSNSSLKDCANLEMYSSSSSLWLGARKERFEREGGDRAWKKGRTGLKM